MDDDPPPLRFRCATCDAEHDLADVSFGADAPAQWNAEVALREGSVLTPDQCVIDADDGFHRFVRACLEIPIRGTDKVFTWGVWVSLSEASFDEMDEHWEDPDRTALGPYFGWLCTAVPGYPDTLLLKTRVHQRPVGLRPTVELEPTAHPLAVAQRDGIEPGELERRVVELLHA